MTWHLSSGQQIELPPGTPCISAPATLASDVAIVSVRWASDAVVLRWTEGAGKCDSKRKLENLGTTTAHRVIVRHGVLWRLLTREGAPS